MDGCSILQYSCSQTLHSPEPRPLLKKALPVDAQGLREAQSTNMCIEWCNTGKMAATYDVLVEPLNGSWGASGLLGAHCEKYCLNFF